MRAMQLAQMRTMQEILLQPMNPEAPVSDIEAELQALGVQTEKVKTFMQRLNETMSQSPKPHTVQQMMAFTPAQVQAMETDAGWNVSDASLLRICMGSSQHPYVFQTPGAGAMEKPLLLTLQSKEGPSLVKVEKGGIQQEVSGRLQHRRDKITEYFPPPTFDEDIRHAPFRSNNRLRIKVVKEIEDVCGDLYPDKEERDVILGSIQLLCGPPDHNQDWNYYWTHSNKLDKKKHKGAAIGDLEKARRNPHAYGCHGSAMEGQMRPARPQRTVKRPSIQASTAHEQETEARDEEKEKENTGNSPLKGGGVDNSDLAGLLKESELLTKAAQLQAQVDAMRAQAERDKQTKKKQQAEAKKAEKELKEAEKGGKKGGKRSSKHSNQTGGKNKKQKGEKEPPCVDQETEEKETEEQDDEEALSEYEQQRLLTMEFNEQWLAFLENTAAAGCKVLKENEAREILKVDEASGPAEARCVLNSYLIAI